MFDAAYPLKLVCLLPLLLAVAAGCNGSSGRRRPRDAQVDSSTTARADAGPAADGGDRIDMGPEVDQQVDSGTEPLPRTGPPSIVSLNLNTPTLYSDESIVISAVLRDPDGAEDIVGGDLRDPGTGRSYGAFAATGGEGAYAIDLDWAAFNAVQAIEAPPGGTSRAVLARFFDSMGLSNERTLSIALRCDRSGPRSACGGECFDLNSNRMHCGRCNNVTPEDGICTGGVVTCLEPLDLICDGVCRYSLQDPMACGGCGRVCPNAGDIEAECDRGLKCQLGLRLRGADSCQTACASYGYQCSLVFDEHTRSRACTEPRADAFYEWHCYCELVF